MPQNLYDAIDVSPGATREQIEAACLRLGGELRDKTNLSNDAKTRFSAIEQAYETLTDPEKRAAYDAELRSMRTQSPPPPAQTSPGFARPVGWLLFTYGWFAALAVVVWFWTHSKFPPIGLSLSQVNKLPAALWSSGLVDTSLAATYIALLLGPLLTLAAISFLVTRSRSGQPLDVSTSWLWIIRFHILFGGIASVILMLISIFSAVNRPDTGVVTRPLRANIQPSCSVNGRGEATCTFRNIGEGSGSKCVRLTLFNARKSLNEMRVTSAQICSGVIEAGDVRQTRQYVPFKSDSGRNYDPADFCSDGFIERWRENCIFEIEK